MCRLTTGIRSEKCVVRRFRHCVNVIECTYTNLDSTVEPTAHKQAIRYSLLLLCYKPVQHVACFLLGNSPAAEFYMPTFRNTLSVPSS